MTTPLGKLQTRGGRAHRIPLLGKLHRHVVPGMQYDARVVPGISWSLGKRVFFYRFSFRYHLSLSLPKYRNSAGTVFLIVSFSNDNSETFGKISIPTIFLSTFLTVLV